MSGLGICIGHEITGNVQRRWNKIINGFENITYYQKLKDLDLFSVEGRLLGADLIKYWKIFHSKCGICSGDIIVLIWSCITRNHRLKNDHEHFSLDCRRRSLALRVASTWNSLPDDVVVLETLGSFKRAVCCFLNEKCVSFHLSPSLRYFV